MVRRKVGQMGQVRRGGIVNYELGTSYKLAPAGDNFVNQANYEKEDGSFKKRDVLKG